MFFKRMLSAGILTAAVCFAAGIFAVQHPVEKEGAPAQINEKPFSLHEIPSCRAIKTTTEDGVVLQFVMEERRPIYIKQFVIKSKNITN